MVLGVVHVAEEEGLSRALDAGFSIRLARRHDEARITAFLRRDEPSRLFLLSWIEQYGVARNGGGSTFSVYVAEAHDRKKVLGVCIVLAGRMVAPYGGHSVGRAFGIRLRRLGLGLDHIVGPNRPVRALWAAYARGRNPRLDRPQRFMVLDPGNFRPLGNSRVRRAQLQDLDRLVPVARAMYREETLVDPWRDDPAAFRKVQAQRVDRGQTFVWADRGELIFKTDVSSFSLSSGAQLAGVYTIPSRRGQKVASRALSDICRELLAQVPRLTLYVNEDNLAARRVYQRLGFRDHTPWRSIFVR